MKALVFKELRETAAIAAVALVAYAALLAKVMGARLFSAIDLGGSGPFFVDGSFHVFYCLITGALAVSLGFRQSTVESSRSLYLFLLHFPRPRYQLFAVKLACGVGVFVICAALPILCLGVWASIDGNEPAPFAWSMTAYAWWTPVNMLLLYPAAFLCGIRPAAWLGTRLVPLVAACCLILLANRASAFGFIGCVVALAAGGGLFLVAIGGVVQTRDFA